MSRVARQGEGRHEPTLLLACPHPGAARRPSPGGRGWRLSIVNILGLLVVLLVQNVAPLAPRSLLDQYCVSCHNQRLNTAGLALDKLDPSRVEQNPEAWETV